MAKEQRPHDLGAEPRLTVKSSVNASEKQLEKASQKAKSLPLSRKLSPSEDVVVSDSVPQAVERQALAAEETAPAASDVSAQASAAWFDRSLEAITQSLSPLSTTTAAAEDSWLSNGFQMLAQATTGAVTSGASGSAAASTAATTTAAGAGAAGAGAATAAAAGAVSVGAAVAATAAVAVVAAAGSKEDTKDTTPPTAPTLALASDTNITSDGITNNGMVNVSGLESGATWQYSTDGGTTWKTGSGSSLTLVAGVYAANTIKVRQSDVAGNVSPVASLATAVTVDTTAPAAPSLALTTDTNITTDGITHNGSVTVSGLEAGTTWQYSTDGGTIWSAGSGTSFTLGNGTYAANAVKVRQTDVAGNVSSVGSMSGVIIVDSTAPVAPTLGLASDTNITTDGITYNGSVNVTGLEAGATWQYSTDSGNNWVSGSGSGFTLGAGTYAANAVKVKQTDVAGNSSAVAGNAAAITVDVTAPDAPVVSLQGSTATDVTFSSTLPAGVQAGDTVQLYIGSVALGSAVTVTASQVTAGSVPVTVSKSLLGSAGVKSIQSELTDVAGNHSNKSTALSITYQPDNSVSDGYIQGAKVYLDINRDGLIDPAVDQLVGTTDATGNFSALLTADQLTYDLLAQGGTDVSTGLPYLGMLKAPAGSTVLNPLTTLVQAVASQAGATDQAGRDQAVAAAKLTVQQALNLPAADLTQVDLLKVSLGTATSTSVSATEAVDVQAKAVMVANLIKTGASAMAGAATAAANATDAATQFNSLSNFVVQGLVQNLKTAAETGQKIQLADSSSIGNVLTSALTTAAKAGTVVLDTSKATDALNATSLALANVNEFITAAAGSAAGGGNVAQALTQVVQAQVVAQRDVAAALQSSSGDLTAVTALSNVADVRSAATGVNTSSLVLAQNVTAQLATTADTTAPTVVAVGAKTGAPTVYREGDTLVFGINFSEGVLVNKPVDGWVNALGVPNAGTPTYTFTIANQERTAVYDPSQSSGSVLRFVYKIKGTDVSVNAGSIAFTGTALGGTPLITDVAGNVLSSTDLPAATLQLPTNWSVQALTFNNSNTDNVAPTVVVTSTAPVNNAPVSADVTFTFTFSESVKGFTVDDVDVVNGIKGKFTQESGSMYTLVVKPYTGFAGQMTVQVKAGQLYDLAGNPMTMVANSVVNVDTQPPTVRIESSTMDLSPGQNTNTAQVKFFLTDAPANGTAFTSDDLVVTGGTLSNFTGAGTIYSATLTLASGATAANIGVKPGAFTDGQGMLSMGSGINFNVQQAANFRTLTQGFVTVGSGQTFAFSNGGTAQDTSDDKQGVYTLQANDKVTVLATVKAGQTSLPTNVQALLDAIANASNATTFASAITAARAVMDLQFGVKLGDNVDITGDGAADKGAVASLVYTPPTGSNVVFAADAASAQTAAVQPVSLPQTFVKVIAGKTLAYANNGTPLNASDDKQGSYTLTGNEIVTVNVAPKPSQALPGNAQVLLNAIKNATDVTAFAAAVANARALMEVNFGVSLGDSIDITGDKLADKGAGAALLYVAPGNNATSIDLIGDAGVVATSAVQPTLLSQSFLKVSAGKTFAFANNGTPTNSGDDVQGTYTLTSSDKVTVVMAPRAGEAMPVDAALLLSAIKNATSVSAFAAAVAAARAKMEVNFGVNLGDGVDITGDGLADKGAGASLVYSTPVAGATQIDFSADAGAATAVGVQPVVLTQPFVTVGTGKTFAYSNNATPSNTSDDKQGTFILAGTERVSVMASPKAGETNLPGNAQTLLNDIKNASTVTAFAAAVTAAKALMEVNFGVNLGDGVDITGDGLADKGSGASLLYSAPANNATQVTFSADTGAAASVAVQPVVLTQSFVKVGAGQTFAYSNNGTPGNTSDDKQGVYNLTGTEKVTVTASPKSGDTSLPNNAQTLLNAIKSAATLDQLVAAVTAAKAVMGLNFSVNLGDGVDITGDGMADKGATASIVGSAPAPGALLVTFAPDSGSTTAMGIQPVLLTQTFVRVSTGPTFAYANNGTPANTSDDKQGVYNLAGTEKVTVVVSPKSGEASMPSNAQTLLNAIKNADTVTAFAAAVTAAKAAMDVYFNVNLGDGVDITGDGLADKGAGVSVVYSAPSNTATQVVFAPDTGATTTVGVQPVVLTQPFVAVGTGKTFAYSSNGTPTNTSDDKQGVYTLTGNEKVTVMASPRSGDVTLPANAQTLLNDIKNATTVAAFSTAVTAAKLVMEVNFGVSLGDGTDITGDGLADKGSGASLIYSAPANNATQVAFMPDVGAATSVGVQPVVLTQTFIKVGTGQTFAFSNNGTPSNTGDDKQGVYTLSGTEKVTVMASPKSGETSLPTAAQTLLNAIKNATTLEQFVSAVNSAKAVMELSYAVNLGDGADITGDGLADKGSGASLVWNAPTSGATQITFLADAGAATSVGVQPVVLTQNFVKVGTGQTFAYSNNGTPTNSTDDKQGVYTLTGTEKVSVMASPKSGDANLPANAQTLLNDIKNATTVTAFAAAVAAAKALMDVNFGVNLSDGADITGDALADKGSGASVVYSAPANGATQVAFAADAGAATSVGVQPVVLSQSFVKVGTGNTFAFANNATPTNTSDDKQGVYTLSGTEKVTVMAAPKSGETSLPTTAQSLLNAIKSATTLDGFVTAVNTAKAVMEINFGVNLGDSVDITGDGLADKGAGASLFYSAPVTGATQITLTPDTGSAATSGVQPVVLTQSFVKVGQGQTFAFSNNGTPTNTSDDKQGSYTLTGTEKVTVMAAPKLGESTLPASAQTLLNAIKSATTMEAFLAAVSAARAVMEITAGVSLGDGVDITGDGLADKGAGAALVISIPAAGATQITFAPDTGSASTVGVQPVVLDQNFVKVGTGQTPAFSNNGTPANTVDDKQGVYALTGAEKVTVTAAPKAGDTALPANAQSLLNAIKSATTLSAWVTAVTTAKAAMDVNFSVNLGDSVDITGDGMPDKSSVASLVYAAPGANDSQVTLTANAGAATSGGAFQPVVLTQSFVKVGTGQTSAYANNGTPTNMSDDKSGVYTLTGNESVTVNAGVKQGTTTMPTNAQSLLNAIKAATTVAEFDSAVNAAKAVMDVNFGVNLGDGVDITGDGVPDWNAYALLTMQGGTATNGVYELKPMVDAPTALPAWITDTAYGTKSTTTTALSSPQAAISSLLINDGESASWLAKANDGALRPSGASLNGAPLELSFAFQTTGAAYLDGNNGAHTIQGSFSDGEKTFMRSVFNYFAQVANIKFTESASQASADNGGGGAYIRIFKDTAAALGSDTSTLGFAFQPTSNNPKTSDRDGNFFMVSDAKGLTGTPFQRPYDDAKNTVVHELGHSLGLDHPFADSTTGSPGFDWYGSTAASVDKNTVYANHLGVSTGGGHDTPATDYMLETIMTYQNPYKGVDFNQAGVTSSTNTPWKLGVYDIAALQHLYGANMAYNIGNNTYTYSSDELVFDTIWDAGGSGDMIAQTGNRPALIDLRGGDHFSRVGLYGGSEYDFSKTAIEASHGKTMTGMKVQYQLDNGTFVDTGILTTPTDTTWHWISDPLIPAGKTATATLSFSDGATLGLPIPAALPDASMAYNLGIAFGVVIEQASGGSGDDVLVNNIADNILFGNAGRDTFVYFDYAGASNGNDVIKDFQDGIDKLEIVKTPTGNVAGVGTAFANATDAAKYFAAVQSGSDTKVTLYDGLATGSNNVVGSVTLSNFLVANLTYEDFKVI